MTDTDKKAHTAALEAMVPDALECLHAGLSSELTIAQIKCIEMILRGTGVVPDGRVLAAQEKKPEAKPTLKMVKVRYTTPMVKDVG